MLHEPSEIAEMLHGAYDLHVHLAPDPRPRKTDEYGLAKRFLAAGMRGFAIKSHFTPTAERAQLLNRAFPGLQAVGGVVLNSAIGGVNPMAVEACARMGGKFIWFPTIDSAHDFERLRKNIPAFVEPQCKLERSGALKPGISILDDAGRLLPDVGSILEIALEYDMVVCSGHMSHSETFALVRAASQMGVQKIVVTHVDWKATYYELEEQIALVRLGALLEHCYATTCVPFEVLAAQIKAVGCSHFFISTDLGMTHFPVGEASGFYLQGESPFPDEGLSAYAEILLANGFARDEIRRMFVENPYALVN